MKIMVTVFQLMLHLTYFKTSITSVCLFIYIYFQICALVNPNEGHLTFNTATIDRVLTVYRNNFPDIKKKIQMLIQSDIMTSQAEDC
jgi:hypothetical protein